MSPQSEWIKVGADGNSRGNTLRCIVNCQARDYVNHLQREVLLNSSPPAGLFSG